MLGDNFVRLIGRIKRKKFNTYDSGAVLFKATLAIPVPPEYTRNQFINVSAWGDLAEELGSLSENTRIEVQGHIEKSSFDTTCKYCGGHNTMVWVEVVIDNFIVLED